jgi:hypothetical protein
MSQTFKILRENGEYYTAEFTKRGVFFWKDVKFIVHHPIVKTDTNEIGVNPSIWTATLYKQGVNLTGEYPDVLIKSIKQAKDIAIKALEKRGLKNLNKILKKCKIINEIPKRDKPAPPIK